MNTYKRLNDVVKSINKFINSTSRIKEWRFCDGFFLKLKKHIKKGVLYLDIHTSGYDGKLGCEEAKEFIKWELLDCQANGILA